MTTSDIQTPPDITSLKILACKRFMVLRPGLRVVILALILASLGGTNGAELDLTWMGLVGWETRWRTPVAAVKGSNLIGALKLRS